MCVCECEQYSRYSFFFSVSHITCFHAKNEDYHVIFLRFLVSLHFFSYITRYLLFEKE